MPLEGEVLFGLGRRWNLAKAFGLELPSLLL